MNHHRLTHIFIIFLLISNILFILPLPYNNTVRAGTTYYVDDTGGDNGHPGTLAEPWETIDYGVGMLSAGDTLIIRDGTYNEHVTMTNIDGTAANWITVRAENQYGAVIDGNTPATITGLAISNGLFCAAYCEYVIIDGLYVRDAISDGSGASCIVMKACNNSTVQNCQTYHCPGSGIRFTNSNDTAVAPYIYDIKCIGNWVRDARNEAMADDSNEALDIVAANRFEVYNNLVDESNGYLGLTIKTASTNGLVHDNELCSDGPSFYMGNYYTFKGRHQRNITIYNNYIHGDGTHSTDTRGCSIGGETKNNYMENITFYNNIFDFHDHPDISEAFSSANPSSGTITVKNITFINNVFIVTTSASRCMKFSASTGVSFYWRNVVIRNNIFKGVGLDAITISNDQADHPEEMHIDNNLFYTGTDEDNQAPHWCTSSTIDDPEWYSGSDFHLNSTSPCIDIGSSTDAPTDDYDSNPRPQGAGYDIGPYEYGSDKTNITVIWFNTSFRAAITSNHKATSFNTSFLNETEYTTVTHTYAAGGINSTNATLYGNSTREGTISYGFEYGPTTGYGSDISALRWFNQSTLSGHSLNFYKSSVSRHALRTNLTGFPISVAWYLTADVQPVTGIVYSTVRYVSNNTVILNSTNTRDAADITAGSYNWYTWYFNDTLDINSINTDVYICVETDGGALGNQLRIVHEENTINGMMSYYYMSSTWFDYPAHIPSIKLNYLTYKNKNFSVNLTGLSISTLYHYRAFAINDTDTSYGADMTFLTKPEKPYFISSSPYGTGYSIFFWKGNHANNTIIRGKIGSYPSGPNDVTSTLIYNNTGSNTTTTHTGLTVGDTWYYSSWSWSKRNGLNQYSYDNYSMLPNIMYANPDITTNGTEVVGSIQATLIGYLSSNGSTYLINPTLNTTCYFQYGTTTSYGTTTTPKYFSRHERFNESTGSLKPGTLYHFRAVATNFNGTDYGIDKTFLTRPYAPNHPITNSSINSTKILLTWIGNLGQNTTKIQRTSGGGYPATNTSGTTVFNQSNTTTSFLDTNRTPGTLYYYRMWGYANWNDLHRWSDPLYQEQTVLTRPSEPTQPRFISYKTSVNTTWTEGTGSNRTTIIGKNGSFPTTRTDGTALKNTSTSKNYYNTSMTSGENYTYFNIFSYKNKIDSYGINRSAIALNDTSVMRGRGWIIKNSGFHIGNTFYNTSKDLYFASIIVDPSVSNGYLKLNSTYLYTTSVNPLTIQIEHLGNQTTYPQKTKFLSFNATTTSPSVQFQIKNLTSNIDFYLYVDNNYDSKITSDSSGTLTFTHSTWSSHHFTLFTTALNYTIRIKYENYTYKPVNISRYGPHQLIIQYFDHREVNWIYGNSFYYNESKFAGIPNLKKGIINITATSEPLYFEFHWNDTNSTTSTQLTQKFYGFTRKQNGNYTYINLNYIPINRSNINLTCFNASGATSDKCSYPSFVWDGGYLLTIYPNTAREFSQVNVTYTYKPSFNKPRCNRIMIPTANNSNITIYIITNKLLYGESTIYCNDSLVRFIYSFNDQTGYFSGQPYDNLIYTYFYTYNNASEKMIIHKQYWDTTQRVYPWLLFDKHYFVGIGSEDYHISNIGFAPTSECGVSTQQITITSTSNISQSLLDIVNITSGWNTNINLANNSCMFKSFWVYYVDTSSYTTLVTFKVYNITSKALLQTNTTNLSIYNFSYREPHSYRPSTYRWCLEIQHPYWNGTQTICSITFPYPVPGHGKFNGSWISWLLNQTIGPSPFKNTDTGKEVPWVYVFIFFIAFFLLMTFDIEHINIGVMASGMWLMFSGYIFNHMQTIGTLGAVGIIVVGLFMLLMGIFAELGGFR